MNRKNFVVLLPVVLISPLFSLFLALKGLKGKYKKWLLILLVTVFGSNIVLRESADSFRHEQNVYEYYDGLSFKDYLNGAERILAFDPLKETNDDIYIHTLSYLSGGLLGAPGLFFTFVAFVFGYFFISGLEKVFKYKTFHSNSVLFFSVSLLFVSILFIDNMQTVRTWTGAWVLFNGVFGYAEQKKTKYLFLIAFAPMIHFAYFVMAVPAIAIFFLNALEPKLLLITYFLSFGLTIVNPQSILGLLTSTNLGAQKVNSYYQDPDEVDTRVMMVKEDERNWYTKYGKGPSKKYGAHALIVSFSLLGFFNKRKMTNLEFDLFALGILFVIWSNIFTFIPAVSGRTMANAVMYISASVALFFFRGAFYRAKGKVLIVGKHTLMMLCVLIFVPHLVYTLANTIQFASIGNIFFPALFWVYPDINMSVRELIGLFL